MVIVGVDVDCCLGEGGVDCFDYFGVDLVVVDVE